MSGFDFIFALFSLVLGLAITEMLGGFAQVMKLHARARAGRAKDVRVGWLTPLLGVLVILNQLMFWNTAYTVRETMPYSYFTLLGVVVFVGAYYLFSALVFPSEPEEWPDFDDYYDQHNRLILGGMFIVNMVMNFGTAPYRKLTAEQQAIGDSTVGLYLLAGAALTLVFTVTLIFVRNRMANLLLLIGLIAITLALAVAVAVIGF